MILFSPTLLLIFSSLFLVNLCFPTCHDTVPFSSKLAQSSLVVYGDIGEVSILPLVNNQTKSFNITFFVRCTFKETPSMDQTITIEHTPPINPICYRTLMPGHSYVFFLNGTKDGKFYKQLSFHELAMDEDSTVEILKRTCGLQVRPIKQEMINQCPIVSIGCA